MVLATTENRVFYDSLRYVLPFGLGGAVKTAQEDHPELIKYEWPLLNNTII